MQVIQLRKDLAQELSKFLDELHLSGDDHYFSPHPRDIPSIEKLIDGIVLDQHLLVFDEDEVVAYGLLRGWDAGYAVPSLGIAVKPSIRGRGVGRQLINWLHLHARLRNCALVRLRVHIDNKKAQAMYEKLNYKFSIDLSKPGYLLGEYECQGANDA
jgi:[ribosomal protein S18]-alanine N-acetyltransferase